MRAVDPPTILVVDDGDKIRGLIAERLPLGRIGDLADHVFRDDELVARQSPEQGKVTSMDQVEPFIAADSRSS